MMMRGREGRESRLSEGMVNTPLNVPGDEFWTTSCVLMDAEMLTLVAVSSAKDVHKPATEFAEPM
jgi:hypothetical protein